MLVRLVHTIFIIYSLGLLAHIVLSWVREPRVEPVKRWIGRWYEPVLRPLRRVVKPIPMGSSAFDVTPLLLFLAIGVLHRWAIWIVTGP